MGVGWMSGLSDIERVAIEAYRRSKESNEAEIPGGHSSDEERRGYQIGVFLTSEVILDIITEECESLTIEEIKELKSNHE